MVEKLIHFVIEHWLLVSAFVLVLILLMIEEARSKGAGGSRVSPQAAIRMINRDDAVVLDLRENDAFKEGHIVGSINIPQTELDQNENKLNKYKEKALIIVCTAGQKSAAIATKLRKQGYSQPMVLSGGLAAWKNADLPLIKAKKNKK